MDAARRAMALHGEELLGRTLALSRVAGRAIGALPGVGLLKPWKDGGRHEVPNGLPLRRDVHRLFDLGFVTVRPDLTFAVSRALRDAYANGHTYYALERRRILTSPDPASRPLSEFLEWHGDTVFRAA